MTERHDKTPEQPKTLADWRSNFKLAMLGALAINAGIVGLLAADWEQEATPLAESRRTHDDANDLINQLERVNEITATLEAEKSARIDEAIDTYLDPSAKNFTGKTPPLELYLELEAYDHELFKLKHAAAAELEGSTEDYRVKIRASIQRGQELYQNKLQKLLQKDLTWSGNPKEDFPQLRAALFEGTDAFFSPQAGQKPLYGADADTATEQLETGTVNCRSARFTGWILEDIYLAKQLPLDSLKNLKMITWEDHVSSFHDDGSEGLQLQEMSEAAEGKNLAGKKSPETEAEGVVTNRSNEFGSELLESHILTTAQKERLMALSAKTKGRYSKKDPPALDRLEEAKEEAHTSPEWPDQNREVNRRFTQAFHEKWIYKVRSKPPVGDLTIIEMPPELANEKSRAIIKKILLSRKGNNPSSAATGPFVNQAFAKLAAFMPSEAEEIIEAAEKESGYSEYLSFFIEYSENFTPTLAPSFEALFPNRPEILYPLRFDKAHIEPVPHSLLKRFHEDPDAKQKVGTKLREVLEKATKPDSRLRYEVYLAAAQTLNRYRVLAPEEGFTEQDLKILVDAAKRSYAELNSPYQASEIMIDLNAPYYDLITHDWSSIFKRSTAPEQLQELFKHFSYEGREGPNEVTEKSKDFPEFYVNLMGTHPEAATSSMRDAWERWLTQNPYDTRFEAPEYKALAAEKLKEMNADDQFLLYYGWDKICPLSGQKIDFQSVAGPRRKTDPSQDYVVYVRQRYRNAESITERREIVLGQEKFYGTVLGKRDLYPEDLDWIHRLQDVQGLRLRFYYDDDFDPKTLTDDQLLEIQVGDPFSMKASGQSYGRLADVYNEQERRHLITP